MSVPTNQQRRTAQRDHAYAALVERERPRLQATAYLLTGDEERAERMVALALADLYQKWAEVERPLVHAIRHLAQHSDREVHLPWEPQPRFALVDASVTRPVGAPIMADLSTLTRDQRIAIILERFAELPSVHIASVLERPVDEVLVLARQARAALGAGHPGRRDDAALATELAEAVPEGAGSATPTSADLARGKRLVRRRRLRRGGIAAVAATITLFLVVAAALALPSRRRPEAGPPPTSSPLGAPSASASTRQGTVPACDLTTTTCQAQTAFQWRSDMTAVSRPYVDPDGQYFSGFGFSYDNTYEVPSFWSGGGGALAFEMFRLDRGATEVYIQVATSRRFAVRCGATTRQTCSAQRFMDGNRFLLSESTLVSRGIEVQYSPSGREVITAIARNTMQGRVLDVTRGDLINLVQDPRLHLPQR